MLQGAAPTRDKLKLRCTEAKGLCTVSLWPRIKKNRKGLQCPQSNARGRQTREQEAPGQGIRIKTLIGQGGRRGWFGGWVAGRQEEEGADYRRRELEKSLDPNIQNFTDHTEQQRHSNKLWKVRLEENINKIQVRYSVQYQNSNIKTNYGSRA